MRKLFSKMDIVLLIIIFIYIIFGLVMIYSASSITAVVRYNYEPYHFFIRQAIFVTIACIIGILIILRLPTKSYNAFHIPIIILIIVSLAFLFINGKVTNNAISWYDLKIFKIQPSEFAKTGIIIFMATYYNILNYRKIKKERTKKFLYLLPLVPVGIIVFLVYKQPDLGSTLIIFAIAMMIFFSVPEVKKHLFSYLKILFVIALLGVLGLYLTGTNLLNSMQEDRFTFKNPCSRYTEETGYQVCNGFIAINNGGLFGVGLGNSTQKYLYLPEAHTDFIFPIIVEELGLATGILVILGYVFILYRILKIAKQADNLRCSILAYGTFWYFTIHILVNLLGVLALIPLTGVPLPLLSYGGSFTVNAIIMLFVVQRVCIENKINRTKREIKSL